MKDTIVILGGGGFLGRTLARWFVEKGQRVVILSRNPTSLPKVTLLPWDGKNLGPWTEELEGARAVINLAGRTVNCRYHAARRELMATLRGVNGACCGLPAARWMLEIGAIVLRTATELVVKSRRVIPERLLAEGFTFRLPVLEKALHNLEMTS